MPGTEQIDWLWIDFVHLVWPLCPSAENVNKTSANPSVLPLSTFANTLCTSTLCLKMHRMIWNFFYSVQLDILRVSTANEWENMLKTRREIPYLQATMNYFVYHRNIVMMTFLMIFRRFPTTFRRFPKIFQNCPEDQTNVPEHFPRISENFRRCPKIVEDFRGRPEDVSIIHQRI